MTPGDGHRGRLGATGRRRVDADGQYRVRWRRPARTGWRRPRRPDRHIGERRRTRQRRRASCRRGLRRPSRGGRARTLWWPSGPHRTAAGPEQAHGPGPRQRGSPRVAMPGRAVTGFDFECPPTAARPGRPNAVSTAMSADGRDRWVDQRHYVPPRSAPDQRRRRRHRCRMRSSRARACVGSILLDPIGGCGPARVALFTCCGGWRGARCTSQPRSISSSSGSAAGRRSAWRSCDAANRTASRG